MQVRELLLALARDAVEVQRLLNGIQEILVPEGLGEKLHRPGFHCLHRHRNVAMTGDEDDGKLDARLRQLVLDIEPADARKPHVKDQAARTIRALAAEELAGALERLGPQPDRFQQALYRHAHVGVVIDDEHGGSARGRHCRVSPSLGRVNWNVAPRPELAAAHKRPPCDSMMDRLIGSPMPVPLALVVKNALKIKSPCCAGNPTPVSLTEISS